MIKVYGNELIFLGLVLFVLISIPILYELGQKKETKEINHLDCETSWGRVITVKNIDTIGCDKPCLLPQAIELQFTIGKSIVIVPDTVYSVYWERGTAIADSIGICTHTLISNLNYLNVNEKKTSN